jgi:CheY-like chemotaxis protein
MQAIPRPRVLLVEDDPGVQDVLAAALDADGYEVQLAGNGRAALDCLAEWRPHLILLDLHMPLVDGWAFRRQQLATEEWRHIPVVVISATPNLRRPLDELRAAAILPKPFNLDTALALVGSLTGAAPHAPTHRPWSYSPN